MTGNPTAPTHQRLIRWLVTVAIVGGPVGFLIGGAFSPSLHVDAESTIDAYVAANPVTNAIHLIAFVAASFLLPVGAVGLAQLGVALRRGRIIPAWAAWSIVASTPLTVLVFVLPGNPVLVGIVAIGLLVAGSVPAARAMATTPA